MLVQRLGISLPNIRPLGWNPANEEANLIAWYQFLVGVTYDASAPYGASQWRDSSGNDNHLNQGVALQQPAYAGNIGANKGDFTFTAASNQFFNTTSQISLADDFTIGFRANPATYTGCIVGDVTSNGEFIRYKDSDTMRVSINNSSIDLDLSSGTWGDDAVVISRSSGTVSLYKNGSLQDSGTLANTADIDVVGIRKPTANPYDGTLSEIQIYDTSNATLIANVSTRLKNL